MFLFFVPISASVILVALLQGLNKLGFEMHSFLLEPVFNLWIIFAGIIIGFCLFMRQIFLMLALLGISFLAMLGYYVMYVL